LWELVLRWLSPFEGLGGGGADRRLALARVPELRGSLYDVVRRREGADEALRVNGRK
jgi:hypothetical protein